MPACIEVWQQPRRRRLGRPVRQIVTMGLLPIGRVVVTSRGRGGGRRGVRSPVERLSVDVCGQCACIVRH
jgi:hypothetical protein